MREDSVELRSYAVTMDKPSGSGSASIPVPSDFIQNASLLSAITC